MSVTSLGKWLAIAAAMALASPAFGGVQTTTKGKRLNTDPNAPFNIIARGDCITLTCPKSGHSSTVVVKSVRMCCRKCKKAYVLACRTSSKCPTNHCKYVLHRNLACKRTGLAFYCKTHGCKARCQHER
jgi:hypothetical protein